MTIDIQRHPIIPKCMFVEMIATYAAIDTVLTLHYSNHTTHTTLDKVLESATSLLKRKITVTDLEQIFYIDSNAYHVFVNSENSATYIKFPHNVSLIHTTRKPKFISQVNQWIRDNPSQDLLGSIELSSIIKHEPRSRPTSPSKIVKPKSTGSSPIKISLTELKNDSSKFKFKSKEEHTEKQKNNGMSLLERIRLKEKLKREQEADVANSSEVKYEKYLLQKVQMVYDVIFQLYNSHLESSTQCKSFSLTKLTQTIIDSSSYPLDPKEVKDVVSLIHNKLQANSSESKFSIIDSKGIQIVKVSNLNRTQDLKILH
ncbi:uncharacterized protein SPAPADRAFT_60444 [Spathaspora passalidarum NRRL Y-27907]|uniref:DNA replication factor Cdt1 C-terminal domain-containing protein n=1 Tax=Spathaspora passalidarum (strain NRRL Y-27907 / 11-Y1) TaxID=619300 RepID=G3AL91_SPAPN|nr:uncharacterized protein SPAPADRAFT_60444 [Spathaspora passalidarum NRRL Y-27907]EGW33134.1 hypothetical protein SPAPADRAFT_60444 [Spathaspora passalidarum NRRL Y-27907]